MAPSATVDIQPCRRQLARVGAQRSLARLLERARWPESDIVVTIETGASRQVTEHGQFPDWMPDGTIIFTRPHDESGALSPSPNGSQRRPLQDTAWRRAGRAGVDDGTKMSTVNAVRCVQRRRRHTLDSTGSMEPGQNDPSGHPIGDGWPSIKAMTTRGTSTSCEPTERNDSPDIPWNSLLPRLERNRNPTLTTSPPRRRAARAESPSPPARQPALRAHAYAGVRGKQCVCA